MRTVTKKTADMWSVGQMLCHNTDSSLFKWQTLGDTQEVFRLLSNLEKKTKKTKNVSCVFCGTSQVPQTQHGGYFVKLHLLLLLLLSVSLQLTFLVPEEEGLLCWVWPLEGGVVIVLHTAGQVRSPTLCHRHILNQRVLTADACGHDTWEEKRLREDEDVSGRKSERRRGRREWGRWCVFDCLICEVARLIKKRLIHSNSVRGWSKIQTIKPDYKVMWWRCD